MNNSSEGSNTNFATAMEIIPSMEINSVDTAIAKLETEGHQINDTAKYMLTKIDWKATPKSSYEIVSVSVEDLFGDKEMHTYGDIKAKALENGLDYVPSAIVPLIRLNYEKNGEWVTLAMKESIRDRDNNPSLFYVTARGPESWLRNFDGKDSERWYDYNKFFFIRK